MNMPHDRHQERVESAARALRRALRAISKLGADPATHVRQLRQAQRLCRDAESAIDGALVAVERAEEKAVQASALKVRMFCDDAGFSRANDDHDG